MNQHYNIDNSFTDGGGIRGLSGLFIENKLMEEVGEELKRQQPNEENLGEPRPSDFFTFMIGTSTGGYVVLASHHTRC